MTVDSGAVRSSTVHYEVEYTPVWAGEWQSLREYNHEEDTHDPIKYPTMEAAYADIMKPHRRPYEHPYRIVEVNRHIINVEQLG